MNLSTLTCYSGKCLWALAFGGILILTGCGGGSSKGSTSSVSLSSISVTPTMVSIADKATASLTATGTYSDGTTADITTKVNWTSDASNVVSVGASTGVVTGVAVGNANITAALGGVIATPAVNVKVLSVGGLAVSANTMSIARYDHTASLLTKGPNAGKVLVVGGYGSSSSAISLNALETVELYDPATDKWSQAAKLLIGIGDTTAGRGDHTSVVLNDGRVLVVGGTDLNSASLISTEIYDPVYDTWSFSGSQISGRSYNTITLFPNGKVMVAGGESDAGGTTNTAEIYDPTTPIPSVPAVLDSQGNTVTAAIPSLTGGWTSVASMAKARNAPTATLLPNGKLLMAGGFNDKEFVLKSSELYDPVTDTWSATGNMIDARFQHTALLLTTGPNAGKVLVVGGYGVGILPLASAELYDPSTGLWSSTGSMSVARTIHSAVMLPNGKVLVMGGLDLLGTQLNSTELYDPVSGIWTTTNNFTYARDNFTVTLLPADTLHPNGSVLATGGYGATSVLNSSELYWW